MTHVDLSSSTTPIWVYVINVLQVLSVLGVGAILALGGWKLVRFLVRWKP